MLVIESVYGDTLEGVVDAEQALVRIDACVPTVPVRQDLLFIPSLLTYILPPTPRVFTITPSAPRSGSVGHGWLWTTSAFMLSETGLVATYLRPIPFPSLPPSSALSLFSGLSLVLRDWSDFKTTPRPGNILKTTRYRQAYTRQDRVFTGILFLRYRSSHALLATGVAEYIVDHPNSSKSDKKWLETSGFESPFKAGSGNVEIRKSGYGWKALLPSSRTHPESSQLVQN
ncbi:hypothetical protein B0H14DRAFT_2657693 [Mycena olivaceomarginata]|nr:hypothetical protein B0H14DRAFT_2657693 [Mycena olivaceomarginata]